MSKTILSISMSLDGFIAGDHISAVLPLGENGPLLHRWLFEKSTVTDKKILDDLFSSIGAVIIGSTTYNTAIKDAWEGQTPFSVPAFVVTSKEPVIKVPGFSFINSGIMEAWVKAKAEAKEKNVLIMGGANLAQQFLQDGLLDEIHIHIAPVLLGSGTPLFPSKGTLKQLRKLSNIETEGASHIFYEVIK